MEQTLQAIQTRLARLGEAKNSTSEQMQRLAARLDGMGSKIDNYRADNSTLLGSTYTRWGKRSCPSGAELVYEGSPERYFHRHTCIYAAYYRPPRLESNIFVLLGSKSHEIFVPF